jgi:hypothetical protein
LSGELLNLRTCVLKLSVQLVTRLLGAFGSSSELGGFGITKAPRVLQLRELLLRGTFAISCGVELIKEAVTLMDELLVVLKRTQAGSISEAELVAPGRVRKLTKLVKACRGGLELGESMLCRVVQLGLALREAATAENLLISSLAGFLL